MSTTIIAEPGSTHDGDFDKALELIEVAKKAGADVCKFQWWSNPRQLAERRKAKTYLPIYQKYQYPKTWLKGLAEHCTRHGIEFACTVYCQEDLPAILPFVKRLKIASFENQDFDFIKACLATGLEVIISTGMSHHLDIRKLVEVIERQGAAGRTVLLQCTSSYPCAIKELHLRVLHELASLTDCRLGFSDHSRSEITGALAVAQGAQVVEKHIQLARTDNRNPDAVCALLPSQFVRYVENIRTAEKALGRAVKQVTAGEIPMSKYKVKL